MTWSLEIHHIDVGQGDSTLIIAREDAPLIGKTPIVRSCLIDGGLLSRSPIVNTYITKRAGLTKLDVMVATHYDADHFGGLKDRSRRMMLIHMLK